jgi:hypothetical protein
VSVLGHHPFHAPAPHHGMQHNWGLGMPLSYDAYDESLAHHRHDPRARAGEHVVLRLDYFKTKLN